MAREPIVIERVLPAPPDVVFAAWGDATSLRLWMAPGSAREATVEVDFRVGGSFRIVMHHAERDAAHRGEYLELDPPKRIVMTWISEWAPEDEQRTLVRIDLAPVGLRRTRLVLTHSELSDGTTYDGHAKGWGEILDQLGRVLERRNEACP
jgi:uncharacterized protein YndB with AHSA1/START domain